MVNNNYQFKIKKEISIDDSGNLFIKPYDPYPYIPKGFPEFMSLQMDNPEYAQAIQKSTGKCNEWFNKLPLTFEKDPQAHEWWNLRQSYSVLPEKIIKDVSFTLYFFEDLKTQSDWYEEATEIIFTFRASYGSPAIGVDIYLMLVRYLVHQYCVVFNQEQNNRLIEYITILLGEGQSLEKPENDTERIHAIYKSWLKLFPFEISYFKSIKEHFQDSVPIPIRANNYNAISNSYQVEFPTNEEYVSFLYEITIDLLAKVNSISFLKAGLLDDLQLHRFDLINENHKIKQTRLLGNFREGELKYLDALEIWLANEEKYFEKITSFPGLKSLINSDNRHTNNTLSTFNSSYTKNQLTLLRNILIGKKYIYPMDEKDFDYLFSGQKVIPGSPRIKWLKSRSQAHYFLKVFVYQTGSFDFIQTNNCMAFTDGKKLDSNSKSGGYHELDKIFAEVINC